MLESQTLLLLIPEHVYASSPPFCDHYFPPPPLTPFHTPILMHLFVSLNLVPFALMIFYYCLILNFPFTKDVPVLTDCLLSLPDINRSGLVILLFVLVLNTLGVDELAELL